MRFNRLSKLLLATAGAVALTASPAYAHSGHTFSFTASSYALNANANTTSSLTIGAYEGASMEIDMEAGMKLAHDDQFGNELASNPNDGDQIGTGTATANWVFTLCAKATVNLTMYWDEDMTGAPAGAVAHYRVVAASVGTYHTYAIEQNDANDDYKLVTTLNPTWTCSTQPSDAGVTTSINGTATGGVVAQNPSAADCKVVTATVVDVGGTSHTGTDSKAYGSSTCP